MRAYELHAPRAGAPALVLEALPGPSLADVLAEHGRLPAPMLGHLGRHLCSAARYLHGRGHLHLDIKPSNVIVSGDAARLIDLGLSRPPGPCRAGVGTARNMAPEQALGEHVGPATDAWGIGLVLYEAATGHRPFGDGGDTWSCRCGEADCSWSEPRYLQLERRAPKVRARRRLPVEAAAAIDACLRRDPARTRPTLDALDAALGAAPLHGSQSPLRSHGSATGSGRQRYADRVIRPPLRSQRATGPAPPATAPAKLMERGTSRATGR